MKISQVFYNDAGEKVCGIISPVMFSYPYISVGEVIIESVGEVIIDIIDFYGSDSDGGKGYDS